MSTLPTTTPFALRPTPDEVVRKLRQLPSAPRVLPRLKQLLNDTNSSMYDVVALIRIDPGVAARVLQMGNSAYYSQGLRCFTVDEAVNRVGYDQIYQLVAATVASQVLVRPLTTYALEADTLWQMSVACALATELLAERLEIDRDIAYTIGLLHGVGLVAIDEWAHRQFPGLQFGAGQLPLETSAAERIALGFHNADAAGALLRYWDFPSVMTEPVHWQYRPKGTVGHLKFATVLHVAKWLRTSACRPAVDLPLPDEASLQCLNLTPAKLESLIATVNARMTEVGSLLNSGLPETSTMQFPNGQRAITNYAPT